MTLVRMQRPSEMRNAFGYKGLNDLMNDLFTEERVYNQHYFAIPPANIVESKFDFRIEIAAPGFEKSDFKIDLDKNLLTVSIDKKVDENADEKYSSKEYSYNSFSRSFRISDKINAEKINAIYKSGILQIVLPKKEEAIENQQEKLKSHN